MACEETLGEPTAVSIYLVTLLTITRDPAIRREARMHEGHVLVAQGDWERAVAALEGEDSFPARRDRAMALAQLGRTDQALIALEPDLAASDTTVRWLSYVDVFAVRNSAATDRLLDRIVAFPNWPAPRRAAFAMEAAQAAMAYDPDAAARRLQRLVSPGRAAPPQVLVLQQQLRLSRPGTPSELRGPADSIVVGDLGDATFALRRVADLLGFARLLIAKNDSIAPGAPRGDLTIFALGEIARDPLEAQPPSARTSGRESNESGRSRRMSARRFLPGSRSSRIPARSCSPSCAACRIIRTWWQRTAMPLAQCSCRDWRTR